MNEALRALSTEPPRRTPIPNNELKPPAYGSKTRDAINSIVDSLVGEICDKIESLRHTLDDIQQQVLEGAAGAKHALHDQVSLCAKLNGEIEHTREVIEEIKAAALPGK